MRKQFTLVAFLAFVAALSAGFAAANVQADAAASMADFAITATSVRLDDPQKEGVDSGLRFKVDIPEGVKKADVTNAYTKISFTAANAQAYSANVNATVWRVDESGWNTVLLDIPASDYITEITAQAFVTVNEVEYETAAVTTSIAQTSAKTIAMGTATEENVGHYVAGKVESINLDKATASLDQLTGTAQLSATTQPVDFAVVWKSDNEAVATVDKDGKVTAVGNGTANITATMGGTESAACVVNANNMAISFSDSGVDPVAAELREGVSVTGNVLATMSVVDFNGGKAFGNAQFAGANNVYVMLSYATMKSYFEAYPMADAISFDVYAAHAVTCRAYTRTTAAADASNAYGYGFKDLYRTGAQGENYYKTTIYIERGWFFKLPQVDLYARLRNASNAINEIYVDNFGVVYTFDWDASCDFEDVENVFEQPIQYVGVTGRNLVDLATITINDETTKVVSSTKDACSSASSYWTVSGAYLEKVFASADYFEFDIIANWSGTLANLKIQDVTGGYALLASGTAANAVTVGGTEGYYKLTVRYSKEQFNATKEKTAYAGYVEFRYTGGGAITSNVYFDNFKGVSGS